MYYFHNFEVREGILYFLVSRAQEKEHILRQSLRDWVFLPSLPET